jgi:hypothetical protein
MTKFHQVSEMFRHDRVAPNDQNVNAEWPCPAEDGAEIYTNVNVMGDNVMITARRAETGCHPMALAGVRGELQVQARMQNVVWAAAYGKEAPCPVVVSSTEAVLEFFRSKLGEDLFWVFRVIKFPDEPHSFPDIDRVFGIEPVADFKLRSWDKNSVITLVGAKEVLGVHLSAETSSVGYEDLGDLHSASAYRSRLAICRVV